MGFVTKDDGWRISDELWSKMEPLLPKPKPHPLGCHRPRVPNRQAMNTIFFILRTGAQWNSLDATGICSCSSGVPSIQRVERCRSVRAVLETGTVGL